VVIRFFFYTLSFLFFILTFFKKISKKEIKKIRNGTCRHQKYFFFEFFFFFCGYDTFEEFLQNHRYMFFNMLITLKKN
jgi:hypothetical protein